MNSKLSLKVNYIYNFISQILTLIIPMLTTPYIARVLRENGNGQYSFSFSIITYFILFANLGFNTYGQREISKYRNDPMKRTKVLAEISIVRSITTFIAILILFIALFFGIFGEKYTLIIVALSIQLIAVPFDINFYYQGLENFRAIAIRSIILKIMGLIGVFLFVKTENDTWIYALCLSISVMLSNLVLWPSVLRDCTKITFRDVELKKHIKPAIVIFLPALAVTIYSVLDKTMIGFLAVSPDYENGCYEQAYKLNSIALLLITVISPIFSSRNSYEHAMGNEDKLKNNIYLASNYVWLIGLPLTAFFLVLSPNLCSWFLGGGFYEVPLLLRIMSVRFLLSGFSEIFGNQLFVSIGREKYTTIATFSAALVNFFSNFILIRKFGAVGAAITTSIAEFVVVFVLLIYVVKGKYISIKKIIVQSKNYCIASTIMFFILFILQRSFEYGILSFLLLGVGGTVIYAVILLLLKDETVLYYFNYFLDRLKEIKYKRYC